MGRGTTVGFKLGLVVCVDDPPADQLTSGSNMESHANTRHTSHDTKMCVWGGTRRGRREKGEKKA